MLIVSAAFKHHLELCILYFLCYIAVIYVKRIYFLSFDYFLGIIKTIFLILLLSFEDAGSSNYFAFCDEPFWNSSTVFFG